MTRCLFLAALVCLAPALAFAQEGKAPGPIQLDLPSFKAATATEAAPATAEGQPAETPKPKPARPELDVSKMPFDPESIRQVVKHNMPDIQECYEQVLAETGKKLHGRVVVGFIIGTEGEVADARPLKKKSTLHDPRIVECVMKMRAWRFPAPDDNRKHPIEYPFDLKVEHK